MIGRSLILCFVALLGAAAPALGGPPPGWLPRYDLDIHLDTAKRLAIVHERVTWTNSSDQPVHDLVFNAHAHYTIPDKDIGLLAKTLEILRLAPSEAMSFDGPALEVQQVALLAKPGERPLSQVSSATTESPGSDQPRRKLSHDYAPHHPTALVIPLPYPTSPLD